MNYQKTIKNLLPVVFILWGCFAFPQDTLMLKQAIEIALENNYSIKIIKNKAAIEENKVTRGNAGMLPKIDVIAGDNVSINDTKFELITGDVIEKDGSKSNSLNTSAELTWTLFDGAAMFIAYDKLKMIRELNEVEVQIAIENTVKNVVIAYYETARQQENLNIIGESVKISRARLQRITDRANFGASVKLEILKARVDLNADSSAWLQTELSLANARRNLNFLLARNVNTDFALNTKVEFSVMAPQDELRKSAFERNTLINKALKSKKISELDYRAIRASRYPRISLKSSYGLNQMKSDGGFFVENTSLGFNAGLSASFNIFDGFRKNTQSQNAKIAIQISELMYQEIYSQIDLEVSNAYDAYGKRIGIVKMEEENLITAKQNFERTNDLFKLGQVMSLELREAQLNLIQAKSRRNDASFRAKVAETELLRLSGKLLEG